MSSPSKNSIADQSAQSDNTLRPEDATDYLFALSKLEDFLIEKIIEFGDRQNISPRNRNQRKYFYIKLALLQEERALFQAEIDKLKPLN